MPLKQRIQSLRLRVLRKGFIFCDLLFSLIKTWCRHNSWEILPGVSKKHLSLKIFKGSVYNYFL